MANMHRWDWDDLQFILAVSEHKSAAGAARALRVNHTTVLRRINTFEKAHAIRLFDRLATGYVMTTTGEELLSAARAMQGVVSDLERKFVGQDLRLEGRLRVATCDTLMASVLPPFLSEFRRDHPGISLEVCTGNVVTDLAQRHADVAVRTGDAPTDTLIGRRVGEVQFAVYASADFCERHSNQGLKDLKLWLAPNQTLSGLGVAKWLEAHIPSSAVVVRADSLVSLRQAALSGLGCAPLPCYLGDATPGLVRLAFDGLSGISTGLWVLTHRDLRHTARVHAFTSFAAQQLRLRLSPT